MNWLRIILCAIICTLFTTASGWAAGPKITSVFPLAQDIAAEQSTDIVIVFDTTISPATVIASSIFVFGRWSGVAIGTIQFEAGNTVLRFVPDRPFMAGEWVTVSLAKSIEDNNGISLNTGYTWNFWTKALPGTFDFQLIDDISTRAEGENLVRSYGAYAGDFNRDGYSDLMIPNEVANDIRIFLNDQAGGYDDFIVYPIPNGSVPSTNEGSDFNRDGYIDFAVGNTGNDLLSVWMGEESGAVIHNENVKADQNIRGLCVMDLNGDAMMDIVTANRTGLRDNGNISLLINDGSGGFLATQNIETNSAGETACASIDANGDGILDVFIGAFGSNEVLLFLGDGEGGVSFSDKKEVGSGPWMLAAGDLNGDGFADVVSSNTGEATVSVLMGNGDGSLQNPLTYNTGSFPLAIDLGDLDGDGDLDVVTSNFSSNNYTILENEGNGTLNQRLILPATTAASCTILHDRDNDGDLDITGIDELADRVFLFDNVTTATAIETGLPRFGLWSLDTYPNPFVRDIHLVIQAKEVSEISILIYNALGQRVQKMEKKLEVGVNVLTWDGLDETNKTVLRGVYFIKVVSVKGTINKKIVRI